MSRFTRRLSGLTNRRTSGKTGNEVSLTEDESMPSHPGAIPELPKFQNDEDELSTQDSTKEEYKGLSRSAVQEMIGRHEIDVRLQPEWWSSIEADEAMDLVFEQLQVEVLWRYMNSGGANSTVRQCADVAPKYILAVEHMAAAGGEEGARLATARALAWAPPPTSKDSVWNRLSYGGFAAVGAGIDESIIECLAAELVALCSSYSNLGPTADPLARAVVSYALANAFAVDATTTTKNTNRKLATEQWAAALGNLTPERGAIVVQLAVIAPCTEKHALGAAVLGLTRFIRLDLRDIVAREALTEALEVLAGALDTYLFHGVKDAPKTSSASRSLAPLQNEATAIACVSALEALVTAGDIETVRLEASVDLGQVDAQVHSLFRRIDEVWSPRKATPLPRLSKHINNALSSLAVACMVRLPRDVFGSHLELFVNKRLQKAAMDKKEAPRALANMATFLRGPRWSANAAAPAATRWPRAPCAPIDDDDETKDEEGYLLKKRWSKTTKNLLPRDRPRTLGGYRSRPHAFACCLPVFETSNGIFRPEVLVWIREKSFLGSHYRVADMAANARLAADVVLGMLANSLSTSFVRSLVVQEDTSILSVTKSSTDRLERYVVGIRVMAAVLDTNSGFARYAPHTPFNAMAPGAASQVQSELRSLFVKTAPEQLTRSLDVLASEQFAASNCTGEAAKSKPTMGCVLDLLALAEADQESFAVVANTWSTSWDAVDGPRHDARILLAPDALAPLKLVHACIVQETARSVPLAPWRTLGKAVLDAGVLSHPAYCIRRSFALALQRTLLERPQERVALVSDVLAHAATCLADGAFPSRLHAIGAAMQLLELWHRILRDGADGRDRAVAAAEAEDVLELSQQSSDLGWTARAEATALAFLADDNAESRDTALRILDHVLAIRSAMLRLVDTVGTTAKLEKVLLGGRDGKDEEVRRRASAIVSERNNTIREVLDSHGVEEDIANRAVRFYVDKVTPTNSKQPLAHSSAPTLRKVSRMANELWYGALPLLAAAVGQNLERERVVALSSWAQRLLYASLRKRGAYRLAPDRFQAQLGLLLALHFFKSSSELEQFLADSVWPLLLDEALETDKTTLERLCACCRASSAPAARSVVSSIIEWLKNVVEGLSPERRALRRACVWALIRATVESPAFQNGGAAVDTKLVSLLATACVSHAFLDIHKTTSQSVVDRTLLLDAVAEAIVNLHYRREVSVAEEDETLASPKTLPRWAESELLRLYEWLRQTHIWPRPGGALHTKWNVSPSRTELASSHNDEPCTTGKGVPDTDGLCLSVSGRAAAKLLCMGQFLPKASVEALLDEKSPPLDLSWFLTAERLGPTARCLPWLLSYNAQTLAEAFVRRAVSAPRDSALPFFHAIADQLLPSASLPLPPQRRSAPNVDDSSRYFAQVKRFGIEADLAQLTLADGVESSTPKNGGFPYQRRPPAVASAAVFGDDRFVAGRPERLGACAILLLGLRAMRDADVSIRVRAFLLVRTVTLYLIDGVAQAKYRDFEELMATYWVQFSSENASRRDVECNEILQCVCACLGAVGDGCLRELLACLVGTHARNREEWGGSGATACILGALCKHLNLAAEAPSSPRYSTTSVRLSESRQMSTPKNAYSSKGDTQTSSGDEVLAQLLRFCAAHPEQSSALFTALCARGGGSTEAAQRNAAAIVRHAMRAAALAAREKKPLTLAACQSAALAAYAAAPDLIAAQLTAPLDFSAHDLAVDAARGVVTVDDDAMLEANGAVALLSSLGGAAPDALCVSDRLATVVNFAVLHFSSPTRFGGGAHSLSSEFRESHRIPRLLHTLLLNLQPKFLAVEARRSTTDQKNTTPDRVNALLALLRCGVEAEFLELDWSRPVAALADPTLLCRRDGGDQDIDEALSTAAWLKAVPPLEFAAGGGGLAHPVALVRALAEVLEIACPGVIRRWGEEAFRFALGSRDFPTRLKAVVIYLTLGAPGVVTALPMLLNALAALHARISAETDDASKSSTGVASTAHYQAASCCCALLRIAGAALFEKDAPAPALFWVADAALRTRCEDDTRCRIYRYGVAILRAFCATNLSDTNGSAVATVAERLLASDMADSTNSTQALTSSPLLDAAARLASGLLCDDALTFSDARLAVTAVLARVTTSSAPKKKEARAALACILSALGPWLMARAGSLDVVDTATQLSAVVEAGAGDGGYLASSLRDHLVLATPPDPQAFAQRAAAWLTSAAISAPNPQRLLIRADMALASASSATTPRDSARVAAALAFAAEILLRDDGGPDAVAARAESLARVSTVALNLFSKTTVRLSGNQRQASRLVSTPSSKGVVSRAGTRLRGLARSGFSSLRITGTATGTAIAQSADWNNDGVDDDERLAASAVVALVVQRSGLTAALLDTRSDFFDDDFLGDDDVIVSERLLLIAQHCGTLPLPASPSLAGSNPIESSASIMRLRDHPAWEPYAPYLALLRRGVPLGAVRLRMTAEGLDPSILDLDPDQPAPPEFSPAAEQRRTQHPQVQTDLPEVKPKPPPPAKKKPQPPPPRA